MMIADAQDRFSEIFGHKRGAGRSEEDTLNIDLLERAHLFGETLPAAWVNNDEGTPNVPREARLVARTCEYMGEDTVGRWQCVIGRLYFSPETDAWISSVECSFIPNGKGGFYEDLIFSGQDVISLLKILEERVDYFVAVGSLTRNPLLRTGKNSTLPLHLTPENVALALGGA